MYGRVPSALAANRKLHAAQGSGRNDPLACTNAEAGDSKALSQHNPTIRKRQVLRIVGRNGRISQHKQLPHSLKEPDVMHNAKEISTAGYVTAFIQMMARAASIAGPVITKRAVKHYCTGCKKNRYHRVLGKNQQQIQQHEQAEQAELANAARAWSDGRIDSRTAICYALARGLAKKPEFALDLRCWRCKTIKTVMPQHIRRSKNKDFYR